ncbi:hypothetical protein LshimejAT787_0505610 [Lyophyllum shimeji]|uniref:Small secreted protein n=1 Tax=Lyophyllum shimeji TaxID=47721 RepID=A0A9P3UPX7_LYOSH|nr:hypothetical protein LshimejAT787_0505610 [Lyophyllum shimeji]
MKFSTLFVALAATLSSVVAAPAPEAAGELERRDLSVRVCANANWQPPCNTIFPPWNVCQPFSATGLSGYQSFGPGTGTTCLWYTGPDCTGTQSGAVNYPGWAEVPGFWQFNTASFKCWN